MTELIKRVRRTLHFLDANGKPQPIDQSEVLEFIGPRIILGEPGQGKSVLLKMLAEEAGLTLITANRIPSGRRTAYSRTMSNPDIVQSRKGDAARRQLGTALHLWLADLDPVSVHALACGGGEIADALAIKAQGTPLSSFMSEESGLTTNQLVGMRNKLWNAMKHANDRTGEERDDETLLTQPLEDENEAQLCIGWFDLSQTGIPLPIEAQVFNVWSLAKRGDHAQLDDWADRLFPGIQSLPAERQKVMLRDAIVEHRTNAELMSDPKTDQRPLILPA